MWGNVYVSIYLCEVISMWGNIFVREHLCEVISMWGNIYVRKYLCEGISVWGYIYVRKYNDDFKWVFYIWWCIGQVFSSTSLVYTMNQLVVLTDSASPFWWLDTVPWTTNNTTTARIGQCSTSANNSGS